MANSADTDPKPCYAASGFKLLLAQASVRISSVNTVEVKAEVQLCTSTGLPLRGHSLPRKSLRRLTARLDMTLIVLNGPPNANSNKNRSGDINLRQVSDF